MGDSKIKIKLSYKTSYSQQSFNDRHQPHNTFELLLSSEQHRTIANWFENINNTSNQGLFLVGPPGCGKTATVQLYCQQYGYTVKEFNALDCHNKKIIENVILKMIENVPIDTQLFHKKQYAIVIDELECMSDKNSLNILIKLINQKKKPHQTVNIPLIFISNETNEKKINELKKHCTEIKFNRPNGEQIIKVIDKILSRERFTIDNDNREAIIAQIISTIDGDYRRLLNLLEFIVSQSKSKVIYSDHLTYCLELFQEKFQDYNIYQNTVNLFTCNNIQDTIRIYENDKSQLPMMVHENYCHLVKYRYPDKKDQLKKSLKIISNIIQGDLIDKVMYNTQSWHYYTIHCLTSCYLPAYSSWYLPKKPDIKFTTTLSKHSLQSSNKKKFLSVLSMIGNGKSYSTNDLYYLGNIIRFHAVNPSGDVEVLKNIMRTYNLTFDIIDRIIRFSKLDDTVNYNVKIKNQLKTQLQNVRISKPINLDLSQLD